MRESAESPFARRDRPHQPRIGMTVAELSDRQPVERDVSVLQPRFRIGSGDHAERDEPLRNLAPATHDSAHQSCVGDRVAKVPERPAVEHTTIARP
jgi:hypothetical protein